MMTETFDAEERPGALKSVTCLHYFISLLFKIIMILMLFVCACSNLLVIHSRISTSHNRFRTPGYVHSYARSCSRSRLYDYARNYVRNVIYFGSGHWNEQFLNL